MTALLPKVEAAFSGLLEASTAVTSTFAIYPGKGNEDKEAPCVLVVAESGEEYVLDTGVYEIPVSVTVKYKPGTAPESLDASNAATGAVHEVLFSDALASELTAAVSDFTCMGVTSRNFSTGQDGDCWTETAQLSVVCCASDLG